MKKEIYLGEQRFTTLDLYLINLTSGIWKTIFNNKDGINRVEKIVIKNINSLKKSGLA